MINSEKRTWKCSLSDDFTDCWCYIKMLLELNTRDFTVTSIFDEREKERHEKLNNNRS